MKCNQGCKCLSETDVVSCWESWRICWLWREIIGVNWRLRLNIIFCRRVQLTAMLLWPDILTTEPIHGKQIGTALLNVWHTSTHSTEFYSILYEYMIQRTSADINRLYCSSNIILLYYITVQYYITLYCITLLPCAVNSLSSSDRLVQPSPMFPFCRHIS